MFSGSSKGVEGTGRPPRVFISYSHDSKAHQKLVLSLTNTLRSHGIDAELDQFHTRPKQGWPRWCEEQLRPENSDFVLMICTPEYKRRIEGRVAADEGKGVFWEGTLLYNYLYGGKGDSRFLPVLLTGHDDQSIPTAMRAQSHFKIDKIEIDNEGYKALYRVLTDQPIAKKSAIGPIIAYETTELRLQSALPKRRTTSAFGSVEFGQSELRRRNRYLEDLAKDLSNRLASSIHSAKMFDLDVEDAPDSVHLPWLYRDTRQETSYSGVQEALEDYSERLLLLGGPGSGKTTTLLHIGQQWVERALDDPAAPIPVLVNLSNFDPSPSKRPSLRFFGRAGERRDAGGALERWLANEIARFPGVSLRMARHWIENGRIAALLDGLDEVDDTRRSTVVEMLNTEFISESREMPIVVCSRVDEYRPLQAKKETRLNLDGAITLQPLDEGKVAEYLERANATHLQQLIADDAVLKELSQTPLTLSMMTLAYGRTNTPSPDSGRTATQWRSDLMEAYVSNMLQREERRRHGIMFDENADNDVPLKDYEFSPSRVDRYLGWLAVRMSIRMQSSFPQDRMHVFLDRDCKRDVHSSVWSTLAWAKSIPIALLLAIAATALSDNSSQSVLAFIALAALVPFSAIFIRWLVVDQLVQEKTTVRDALSLLFFIAVGFLQLGCLALAASILFPDTVHPVVAGVVVVGTAFGASLVVVNIVHSALDFWDLTFASSLLTPLASYPLLEMIFETSAVWEIIAIATLLVSTTLGCIKGFRRGDRWRGFEVPFLVAALAGVSWLSTWFLSPLSGFEATLAAVSWVTVGVVCFEREQGTYRSYLSFSLLVFLCVAVIFEPAIAVTVFYSLQIIAFFAFLFFDSRASDAQRRISAKSAVLWRPWSELIERHLLSPSALRATNVHRALPWQRSRFFDYTSRAFLTKKTADGIEFVHRMLRDYFALRELQPALHDPNKSARLEAIRSLGFQGDAATSALIDFYTTGRAEVRAAAVSGLGRIASSSVAPWIWEALSDPRPVVRLVAARSSLNHLHVADVDWGFTSLAQKERDPDVFSALVVALVRQGWERESKSLAPFERRISEDRALRDSLLEALPSLLYDRERAWFLHYLAKIGDQRAFDRFESLLIKGSVSQRSEVLVALIKTRSSRVVDVLATVMENADGSLRKAINEHLALYDPEKAKTLASQLAGRKARWWQFFRWRR